MTPSTTPDEWMAVIVPVGRGSSDRLLDLGPGLETAALQRQRAQHLPPGLDQVQVGGILGLEHELPARMQQAEQQHVGRAVDVEVVEHRVDPRDRRIDPGLDHAQEVDPVGRGATLEGQGESLAAHWLQRAEDVPGHTAPAIVDLLLGPPSIRAGRSHELLAWVALAGLRPHLVETDDNAAGRWRRVELLDRPLLRAKSGSTRAPNQVSSCRHLRPSWMKISLIRRRRMAIPCWLRWTTRRSSVQRPASSVQQANGRPRSAGRVRAAVITALRCSAEYVGGRPLRTSSSSPCNPRALKRLSQCRTVAPHRSMRALISGAFRPSSACRTICARRTCPAPTVRERAIRPSASRSSSLSTRTPRVMAKLPRIAMIRCRPRPWKSQFTSRMHH